MKHNIDIEGLPKGWEPEKVTINSQNICGTNYAVVTATVELRKTKPREITLVEIDETCDCRLAQPFGHPVSVITVFSDRIWRIKEE